MTQHDVPRTDPAAVAQGLVADTPGTSTMTPEEQLHLQDQLADIITRGRAASIMPHPAPRIRED